MATTMTRQHRMERALVRQRSGSKPLRAAKCSQSECACLYVYNVTTAEVATALVSPAGCARLPDHWRCSVDGIAPFNRCNVAEEEVKQGEVGLTGNMRKTTPCLRRQTTDGFLNHKPFLDAFGDPDEDGLGIELKFRQRLLLSNARHPNLLAWTTSSKSERGCPERRVPTACPARYGERVDATCCNGHIGSTRLRLSDQTVGIEDEPTHSDNRHLR